MGFWLTFWLWVASFVLQDYFRAKLPGSEPSGEGDFQSPTATQGRKIPQVVGGTVKIQGPNTIWQGDWEAEAVTVETGMIFKRDEQVGWRYFIGLALGQYIGRAAGMTAIYMGDDKIWDYVADNASIPAAVADIDLPDLFGGERSGGGFTGRVRAFLGTPGQPVSTYLASRVTNQSAWPGLVYVVVSNLTETAGADIGEANQLRDIRVEFQTYDTVAGAAGFPGLGDELGLGNDHHFIGRDSNPISASFRVLNDPDWLLSIGDINFANFKEAAEICYTEGIGYSQTIDSEIEAKKVLAEIEKHVDGYLGPNPTTGLLEWKLARQGYDPALEFQATEDNIKDILDYAKPEWPQLKNEVKIRFVNREQNYNDDHAVAQDMAGRLITNRPQSITVRFPGLREAAAANAIVARTSRVYFWPLAKFKLLLDRTAYALRPGDVVVVTHPDIEAVDLPCRITKISTGDQVKQTIKVDVVQDVFDSELGIQAAPPVTEHVPPASTAVPVSNHVNTIVPRWLLEINDQILEPRLMFMVERDIPNTAYELEYHTRTAPFGGNWVPSTNGTYFDTRVMGFTRTGTLRAAVGLMIAADNNGTASTANGGGMIVDGNLQAIIGTYEPIANFEGLAVINPGAANEEMVAFSLAVLNGGGIECTGMIRGIGDTPIQEHVIDEPVWFLDEGVYMQENFRRDETDGSYGYQYKIAPVAQNTLGALSAFVAEESVNNSRYTKPYPPTAVIWDNLSTTIWFAAGELAGSGPGTNLSAPTSGIPVEVWNRRFDQENAIWGAMSRDDTGGQLPTNSFTDVNPDLKYFVYDLDTHPTPVRGNEILSGTLTDDDRRVNFSITKAQLEALADTNPSPINARFEFVFDNGTALDEVLAGTESKPLFVDKTITYLPAGDSYVHIADTALMLHFEGFDRTTQVIDYSPHDHPVTLIGDAQIDTNIVADTGLQPGSMLIDGTGDYANIPDDAAFDLNCADGFTIQCRVNVTGTLVGEIPLVTKWATTGNQRSFWLGFNGNALRMKISTDGTNEFIETTGTRTWTPGTWYEITVVVFNTPLDPDTQFFFFVDGVFDEREQTVDLHTALHAGTAPLRIGADGEGNFADAMNIDEVRIIENAIYLSAFTPINEEYPGRERIKILHCNWENAADGVKAYDTDDLNRQVVQFPSAEVTEIDDAQSKFGTKSLRCSGVNASGFDNSDGVIINDTGFGDPLEKTWEIGIRDFTMECFVRFAVLPSAHSGGACSLITKYFRGSQPFWNWGFYITKSNEVVFLKRLHQTGFGIDTSLVSPAQTILIDTWYHVAVVRKAGVLSLYFEGDRVAQELTDFDGYFIDNLQPGDTGLGRLHQNSSTDHWALNGWLDEVRVQIGVAEYDGLTYTVPTAAFPVDPLPEAAPAPLATPNNSSWQPTNL